MAVVAAVEGAVKAPLTWAKARPVVFIVLALVIAVLAIKFAPKLLGLIGKAPIVGPKVVRFAQPAAA
jgi:hypothetical protein